jgi:2-methylcitrate dehydratase PrpD
MLPTMTTRDEKGPGPANKTHGGGLDLPQFLGGHLSPAWCLWFMGFPVDWLDVDDAHVFARSATPSSRSAPK